MTPAELDALAKRLYEEGAAERGPRWEQLGEVTQAVWRERAMDEVLLFGDLA